MHKLAKTGVATLTSHGARAIRHALDAKLGPGKRRGIAIKAGVTAPHVSRVLRGKCGASLGVLQKIARAGEVTTDELLAYIGAQVAQAGREARTHETRAQNEAARPAG